VIIILLIPVAYFIYGLVFTCSASNLIRWEPLSEIIKRQSGEVSLGFRVLSITHFPPRLVGWDKKLVIKVKTDASAETYGYIYIGDALPRGTYLGSSIPIPKGINTQKFEVNMATDNLTNLLNARIYIAGPDGHIISSHDYFDIMIIEQYISVASLLATVAAIIIAVLSLWAQLTAHLISVNHDDFRTMGATLTLYLIYIAMFWAVLSLIIFISQLTIVRFTPYLVPTFLVGLGMMIASLYAVLLIAVEPLISLPFKVFRNHGTIFSRLFTSKDMQSEPKYKGTFYGIIVCGLLIPIIFIYIIVQTANWVLIIPILAMMGVVAVFTAYLCHIWHYLK
jgi:hypothetical protein